MTFAYIRNLNLGGGGSWRNYLPSRFRLLATKLAEGFAKSPKLKFDGVPRLEIIVLLKKKNEERLIYHIPRPQTVGLCINRVRLLLPNPEREKSPPINTKSHFRRPLNLISTFCLNSHIPSHSSGSPPLSKLPYYCGSTSYE